VEVGDQAVDDLEPIAGGDEDVGLGGTGAQLAVLRRCFERAQTGRPDRDHLAGAGARAGYGGNRRRRNLEALGVHAVFGNGVHAHRLEGPGTHVQRQPGDFDGTCGELPEQRIVEMQAGGGRRHGAGLAGKRPSDSALRRRCLRRG
jgi:hypothetical protein